MTLTFVIDQLARLLYAGPNVVGGVLDQQLDRTAEDAALFVDFGFGIFRPVDLALRQSRQYPCQRIDHPDFDRLVAASGEDERRADRLTGAECKTRLDKRAAA